jgi:PAP2 superfamily
VRTFVARHYGLAQIGVVLGAVTGYELFRLVLRPDWPLALAHAHEIASWERVAHLAWEAPLQHAFLGVPPLVEALNVFYLAGHFLITGLFFLWLYRRSRPAFRVFRNGFLLATAAAFFVVWLFPTAPPRVAGLGLEDTLRRLSGIDIGSPGSGGLSDPVAAVPSLHAGWALGVGLGVALYARPMGWKLAGALYPAAVVLTILVTGNHFVFDAFTGMFLTALALALAAASARRPVLRFGQRRGVEQSGSSPGS